MRAQEQEVLANSPKRSVHRGVHGVGVCVLVVLPLWYSDDVPPHLLQLRVAHIGMRTGVAELAVVGLDAGLAEHSGYELAVVVVERAVELAAELLVCVPEMAVLAMSV